MRAQAGVGLAICVTACAGLLAGAQLPKSQSRLAPLVRFSRDIQPILAEKCFRCHGPDQKTRMAGLRLDTEYGAFAALASGGKVFAPGSPAHSKAYQRMVAPNAALRMPPPGSDLTVTSAQLKVVKQWIGQGAKWERHWSLITPVSPPVPAVKLKRWPVNPIDNFILARLEGERLAASPGAARETLLRRVSLDLTGIPPTLAEIDGFLADRIPGAFERVVDRLLASPRFGERMVWDWLEAARYSDTNGYQEDRTRPMWPWRDWAVKAINANMPFDQFTVEQIAGDLLPGATLDQRIATGFNRNHMLNGEGGRIPEESRVEYVMDRVDTTTTVWLGLTMGCARCHDHKYDPFTQRDYYQLYAYFNNVNETGSVDRNGSANPVVELPTAEQAARLADLRAKVEELSTTASGLKEGSPERSEAQKRFDAAKKEVESLNNSVTLAMVMEDRKEPRQAHILIRGTYEKPGDKVESGVPAALAPLPPGSPSNRLALAHWLTSPANSLTARVAVNRYWQMLFGTGLVLTTEDFGIQGEKPSHPDLLDWLATDFVRSKWDVKRLVKLIVTSATYRQSSVATAKMLELDPANRLLSRGPRYRLPAFMLRDQALAVAGLLVEKLGGPPVKPYQPEGVWEDFSYGKITYTQDHGESLYRRSLYTFWRRSVAPTGMFDASPRRVCSMRQTITNTPLQSLTLLNDITFVEAARVMAERVMKEAGWSPEERIGYGFQLAAGRRPRPDELRVLVEAFQRAKEQFGRDAGAVGQLLSVGEKPRDQKLSATDLAAYATVMSIILNLDEVLCKE